MITLSIDKDKVITVAMVPYVPSAAVIAMTAEAKRVTPNIDADKIKFIPQLQILRASDLSVVQSVTLTPEELKALLFLGKAIGMSLNSANDLVDKHFDEYRTIVLKSAAADLEKP